MAFAFNRAEANGAEDVKYYRKYSMTGPQNPYRRNPSSFFELYYNGQTPEPYADQRVLPGETRTRADLRNEYRERVASQVARYYFQRQLHEAKVDEVLDEEASVVTSIEVSNLPQSISIISGCRSNILMMDNATNGYRGFKANPATVGRV